MFETIKSIDTSLLLFFNHLNNPVFDFIFYWISDKWIWIPFYAYLAWMVFRNEGTLLIIVIIFIAIAVTISDQIASTLIKPSVMRLRPCHEPVISSQVHLVNEYCGGQYGFISSHAANVFTLAGFLSIIFSGKYQSLKKVIWIWAIVVSFSRIYLGAHYPGDVLGGAAVGVLVGLGCAKAYIFIRNRYLKSIKKT